MSRRGCKGFWRNESGATAALYALALPALVGVAGIGFDYAHIAGMDSELQNAADQAALAGATQLDKQTGAIARATSAAQGGLVANSTLFANDGDTRNVDVVSVTFYTSKGDAEACNGGEIDPSAANADGQAAFVCVTVETRTANFALTPVVGAFMGSLDARAVAGLGSAICKTPPVMMCNPVEPDGNTNVNLDFDADGLAGAGVLLIAGDADAPGNFGFLDTGIGQGNSTPELAQSLGYNVPPGECQPTTGVDLKPGARDVVLNALNTRFDVSTSGNNTCPGGGVCSASRNVRKDLVRGNSCGVTGQGWDLSTSPYLDRNITGPLPSDESNDPDIMGHPRDICHARATEANPGAYCVSTNGGYNGRVGDKLWDRDAYFRVNYGWTQAQWMNNTGLPASATRYDVYRWELNNISTSDMQQDVGGNKYGYSYPVCRTPGITPGGTNVDRRRLSVAVINCEARELNGAEQDVEVLKWVDVFLVEPAFVRKRGTTAVTGGRDVYVEVIGETGAGTHGSTVGQVVRRDVPYLIK